MTGGPRQAERATGIAWLVACVFLPGRYADDFVVLVSGTQEDVLAEKTALADYLGRTTALSCRRKRRRSRP